MTDAAPRGERERDVPRVAHTAVRPHVRAELAGGIRGLEHRRELGSSDRRHHARGAHRSGTDADLHDGRSRGYEVSHRDGGDDVAGDDGQPESERCDRLERAQHPVLVSVRCVEHEHIRARSGERRRLRRGVAVDADRRGDAQSALGVDGGGVERRAQRARAADRPHEAAVVHHRSEVDPGGGHELERGSAVPHIARVERRELRHGQVAQARVRERVGEAGRRDAPEHFAVVRAHDDPEAGHGGHAFERVRDGRLRREHDGGVVAHGLPLDPPDGGLEFRDGHVLGQHPEPAAPCEGGGEPGPGHRVHVGRDNGDGRSRAVVGRERHVHPARH
jgi:hypothetical protein